MWIIFTKMQRNKHTSSFWTYGLQFEIWNIRDFYLWSAWSRVFLEKLDFSNPVKKFAAIYWTLTFITALKSSRWQTLSRATSIQAMPLFPILEIILQ